LDRHVRHFTDSKEEHHPISIVSTHEETLLRSRRALTENFTEHAILEHASVLEDLIGLMVVNFDESAKAGKGRTVIDIADWLSFLTFDIVGALAFGEAFDSVNNGHVHPWVAISSRI
jgi:cytochrome P450